MPVCPRPPDFLFLSRHTIATSAVALAASWLQNPAPLQTLLTSGICRRSPKLHPCPIPRLQGLTRSLRIRTTPIRIADKICAFGAEEGETHEVLNHCVLSYNGQSPKFRSQFRSSPASVPVPITAGMLHFRYARSHIANSAPST
jgi:hypothetical protein